MSNIEGWYQVAPDGHVPLVAAELPPGYWVHLSEAGAIGAIQEQMPEEIGGPVAAPAPVPAQETEGAQIAALEAEGAMLREAQQSEANQVDQAEAPPVNGG